MKRALLSLCAVALTACPGTPPRTTDGSVPDSGAGGGHGASDGGSGGGGAGGGGGGGGGGGAANRCGDGAIGGLETCDDGNLIGGDGCTGACIVEIGYACSGQPSTCWPLCGDGRKFGSEACDDGNTAAGDGCSSTCTVEPGFTCTGVPASCTTVCGDRVPAGPEECDDGNGVNGDGCSSLCLVEPGYSCDGGCGAACGDGVKASSEGCDDGNLAAGDGCSAACLVEFGFHCVGSLSTCTTTCGDGLKAPSEFCDDGFTDACGSCDATCSSFGGGFSCGDGATCPEFEACDDFNTLNTDACPSGPGGFCVPARCGDGFVWAGHEGCDDGNTASGDGCSASCAVESTASGTLSYQKVPNILVLDDLSRVAWHPSGRFAVLLGTGGKVVQYDAASRGLSLVQTLGSALADLEVAQDGSFFLVVGQLGTGASATQHLWRLDVGVSDAGVGDALSPAVDQATLTGTAAAIAAEPGGTRFALITRGATLGLNYLYTWTAAGGLSAVKGYNSGAGALSLMWGAPSLYAGSANVLTGDGLNGADSKTWLLSTNVVSGNAWSPGFGNPGGAAWQPGGTWGAFTGWSSNKLYVFNGGWTMATLPVPTGAGPTAMAFRADGHRALVVGRAIGLPLYAVVIDYQPAAPGPFDGAALVDSSIPNFNLAPWFGTSNVSLLDVAWRPGLCDEGLIVGTDNGSQFSPTYGTVIRFYDPTDADCVP